jgi:hypothetical protein
MAINTKGDSHKGKKPKTKLYPNPTGSGTWASTTKPKKPTPSSYGNFGKPLKPLKIAPQTTIGKGTKPKWLGEYKNKVLGAKSEPIRNSSGSPKGVSAAFRNQAAAIGTNGGSSSAVGHNPNTGGRSHSGKGHGLGKGNGGSGGGGFNGGDYLAQARKYVNADIRRAVRGLRNEKDARKTDMRYDISNANALYDRSQGDINHIFGEVNDNIQTQAILNRLAGNQAANTQDFAQLGQGIDATTDANKAALMAELSRLGIQSSANTQQMDTDSNFAQLMAQTNGANSNANLLAMGQGAGDIGSLISQMSNASRASNIGQQVNRRNDSIGDARQEFRAERDELRNGMRDERSQRGTRIWDLYRQLEDQGYNRWFQNREANRANRLGWSNFNLSADGQNADIMFQQAQMIQDQRAAAAERRAIDRQMRAFGGGGGGSNATNPGAILSQKLYGDLFG